MDCVQLKGVREGLKVVISPAATMADVTEQLRSKLEQAKELVQAKQNCTITVDGAGLMHRDKCRIQQVIFETIGTDALISFGEKKLQMNPESVFHTGTLRAGQNLQSEGHLVVLGDVNPGAEVVAAGNIVVLGVLKGLVHAGAGGDRSACVSALQMCPTQIRIADIITRSPDGNIVATEPEIAYVKDDRIYIDSIMKR